MAPFLPNDVFYLICEVLFDQQEFHTLFCCALASRRLAGPAVSNLYRMQNVAPVTLGGADDSPQRQESSAGLAKLWRSLISSCQGETLYPYCKYIRTLDLHDLTSLLEDNAFRSEHHKDFFSGSLAFLRIEIDGPPPTKQARGRGKRPIRLDANAIARQVGNLLTEHTMMLEELAGDIESAALAEWLPRLRHLRYLRLWSGVEVHGLGPLVQQNCPEFHHLTFYQARGESADLFLSEFVAALSPNTLESYMVASYSDVNQSIFTSFNHHASSLTTLKLDDISGDGLFYLSNMNECRSLHTLTLQLRDVPAWYYSSSDRQVALNDLVHWLLTCKNLTEISLKSSFDSGDIFMMLLTPLLVSPALHLTSLAVLGYSAPSLTYEPARIFYSSLPNQAASLRSLALRADGELVDVDAFTTQLTKLTELTDLRLQGISDYFLDKHIEALARHMPLLEDLWVSGFGVTDAIWTSLGELSFLRRLEISAFSHFTYQGILSFMQQLNSEKQHGFYLSVMMADPNSYLAKDPEQQDKLRLAMLKKAEGRFEFTLSRGKFPLPLTEMLLLALSKHVKYGNWRYWFLVPRVRAWKINPRSHFTRVTSPPFPEGTNNFFTEGYVQALLWTLEWF